MIAPIKKTHLLRFATLESLTIGYLFLPHIFFMFGWLKWQVAIPLVLLSIVGVGMAVRQPEVELPPFKPGNVLKIALLAAVWCFWLGIDGTFMQSTDHYKHNAIFKALINLPWPVTYEGYLLDGKSVFLHYYFAYYLPPAWVAKWAGIAHAESIIFIWTVAGVNLSLLWVQRLGKLHKIAYLIIFILLGGMDAVMAVIRALQILRNEGYNQMLLDLLFFDGLEHSLHFNWGRAVPAAFFSYIGNTNHLHYVPQHTLGAWLTVALIVNEAYHKRQCKAVGLITALSLPWSIFVFLGVLPYSIYYGIQRCWKKMFTVANLVGAVLVMFYGIYYLSHLPVEHKGFIWEYVPYPDSLFWLYVIMTLTEWGIVALAVWPYYKRNKQASLFYLTAIILLLIPFYKLGRNNDFIMRVSMPALFIFWILVVQAFKDLKNRRRQFVGLLLILSMGAQIHYLGYQFIITFFDVGVKKVGSIKESPSIIEIDLPPVYRNQYFGYQESIFYQYLAKKREPSP